MSTAEDARELGHELWGACLASRAQRLQRQVTRHFDGALRVHGLTAAQMSVLALLSVRERPTLGEIAAFLELQKSTLTRNLRLLESDGLIKIEALDGRTKCALLTRRGRGRFVAAGASWREAQASARERWGHDAPRILDDLVRPNA